MSLDIEPHFKKQCDHDACPKHYIFTEHEWNN